MKTLIKTQNKNEVTINFVDEMYVSNFLEEQDGDIITKRQFNSLNNKFRKTCINVSEWERFNQLEKIVYTF